MDSFLLCWQYKPGPRRTERALSLSPIPRPEASSYVYTLLGQKALGNGLSSLQL